MPQLNDLSRSLAALEQDTTLIAAIEMGQSIWLPKIALFRTVPSENPIRHAVALAARLILSHDRHRRGAAAIPSALRGT
jgi:hypothetical protein